MLRCACCVNRVDPNRRAALTTNDIPNECLKNPAHAASHFLRVVRQRRRRVSGDECSRLPQSLHVAVVLNGVGHRAAANSGCAIETA